MSKIVLKAAVVIVAGGLIAPDAYAKAATPPPGWAAPSGIVSSPNECLPDKAAPVWGGRSGLLGYACVRANANG
jgi:hypothetical protein